MNTPPQIAPEVAQRLSSILRRERLRTVGTTLAMTVPALGFLLYACHFYFVRGKTVDEVAIGVFAVAGLFSALGLNGLRLALAPDPALRFLSSPTHVERFEFTRVPSGRGWFWGLVVEPREGDTLIFRLPGSPTEPAFEALVQREFQRLTHDTVA